MPKNNVTKVCKVVEVELQLDARLTSAGTHGFRKLGARHQTW